MLSAKLDEARERLQRLQLRRALPPDVVQIEQLLVQFAAAGLVIQQSLDDLYDDLQKFWVAYEPSTAQVVACAALQVYSAEWGELRSLAVAPALKDLGLGKDLMQRALQDAVHLKLRKVFVFTAIPPYFERQGFRAAVFDDIPSEVIERRRKLYGDTCMTKQILILKIK